MSWKELVIEVIEIKAIPLYQYDSMTPCKTEYEFILANTLINISCYQFSEAAYLAKESLQQPLGTNLL